MASRNCLAVGICWKSSGIFNSSLFEMINPYLGSNLSAETILPTRRMNELNCLALAINFNEEPVAPENECAKYAWRYRSPKNETFVAALMEKFIGLVAISYLAMVVIGSLTPPDAPSASMLKIPSG